MLSWLFIIVIVCGFVLWRKRSRRARNEKPETASVMIVAGSGGHTGEMLRLVEALPSERYTPRMYVVSRTDTTSENRIHQLEGRLPVDRQRYCVLRIPRSREVHQSWLSTALTATYSVAFALPLVFQRKPDVILCNGPGTCVPICLAAFLFRVSLHHASTHLHVQNPLQCPFYVGSLTKSDVQRILERRQMLGIVQTKVVYVESICRVDDLSLSGKLLYRLVDQLIVQWPELLDKYGGAKYIGPLS